MTYYIRPLVNTVAVNRTNDTVTIDGSVYYPIFHTPPSNSQSPQSSQNVNVNVNVTVGILWGTDTANLSVLSTLPYAGGNGAHRYESQTSDIQPGTLYYFAAYCDVAGGGRTIGEILALTTPPVVATPQPCPGNETVTDIDGNVYNTVQVGSQCWMKEDLRTTRFATGRAMNYAINNERFFNRSYNSLNGVMEGYYDAATSMADYGYPNASKSVPYYAYNSDQRILYNVWGALNGHNLSSTDDTKMQGACPDGWHVPSRNEWYELAEMMGGQPSSYYGVYLFDDLTRFTSASSGSGLALEESSIYWLNIQYARLAGMSDDVFYYTGVYLENYHDEFRLSIGNGGLRHILNSVRCVKGDGETFAPVVRLGSEVTDLEAEAATLMPLVVVDGGKAVTSFRVLYGTSRTSLNRTLDVEEGMNEDENGNLVNYAVLTGLTPNTTYYAVAAATNANGTSYSDTIMFTTPVIMNRPCADAPTVTDIDGNVYNTVQVGNQCWMKEDLRTTHFATGKDINMDGRYDGYTYSYLYPYYGYDNSNRMLYNAAAVLNGYMDNADWATRKQGVCPEGWHVPSVNDWNELLETLGGVQVSDGQVLSKFKIDPSLLASSRTGSGLGLQINSLSINRYISSHQYRSPNVSTEAGICVPNVYYRHSDSLFIVQGGDFYMEYYRPSYSVRCVKGAGIVTTPAVVMHEVAVSGPEMATAAASVPFDGGSEVTSMVVRYGTQRDALTGTAEFDYSPNYGDLFHHTDITDLTPNTTYYAVAAATNANGTSYSDTIMFTTPVIMNRPCADAPTVTDIDGNVYNTVQVGNQCWMKEDLRTTHFATGRAMNYATNNTERFDDSYTSSYGAMEGYYNADPDGLGWYGYPNASKSIPYCAFNENQSVLYNVWGALNGHNLSSTDDTKMQGACPDGWHIPSRKEWFELARMMGGTSRSAYGIFYFDDLTRFTSASSGSGLALDESRKYWLSSIVNSGRGYVFYSNVFFYGGDFSVNIGNGGARHILNSVRCVKGDGETFAPVVRLGSEVTDLEAEAATLMPLVVVDGGKAVTSFRVLYGTSRTSLNRTLDVEEGMNEDENGNLVNYAVLTGLTPNTTYYAVAAATNANGTSYSDTIMFTTPVIMNRPCADAPTVTDIDGNVYNTVQVGNQCWMKEDLRTTKFATGRAMNYGQYSDLRYSVALGTLPFYAYNPDTQGERLGTVYNVFALANGRQLMYNRMNDPNSTLQIQGVCPDGWHLPSVNEWKDLAVSIGGEVERGTGYPWGNYIVDEAMLNSQTAGSGLGLLAYAAYASSNTSHYYNGNNVYGVGNYSHFESGHLYINIGGNLGFLMKVRCVKGEGETFAPVVRLGSEVTELTAESATLMPLIAVDGGKAVTSFRVLYGTSRTSLNRTLDVEEGMNEDENGNLVNYAVLTGLTPNTTYYAVAAATNANGTSYSDTIMFTTPRMTMNVACPGTPYVSDIEGNFYNTVQIGNQCWMKENLRTKRYADGTQIPFISDTTNGNRVAYYRYPTENNNYEVNIYGYFYSHAAVMRGAPVNYGAPIQGICPTGWHLPSKAEFDTLIANFTFTQVRDVAFWTNRPGTNESGLSLRAAGYYVESNYQGFGVETDLWSSYSSDSLCITYSVNIFDWYDYSDEVYVLASVRCIKGQGRTSFPPIVTTQSPYNYTQNTFSVKATVNKAGSTISRSGFVIGTSDNVTTATATSTQDVLIGTDGTMTKTSFSIPYNNQLNFTWYVRGYVTTSDGETVYGNAVKVEVQNVSCGSVSTTNPSVTYNTVQIGNQCWMKENLKTKGLLELGMYYDLNDSPTYKYSGYGYMLPYSSSANGSLHSCNTWSGYYYTPNDVLSLSYSARASSWSYHNSIIPSNIKSICPDGWHLPNMAEYELMVTNVNGGYSPFTSSSSFSINQALSDKLRDNSSTYWSSYTTATNSSGFSARGAGYIPIYDFVTYVRASSHFITSSYASNYIIFALNPTSIGFTQQSSQSYRAISIRCVKDITDMTVSMNTNGIPISTQTLTVSARITNRYSYPIVERGFIFEGELKPQSTTSNSFQQTFTRTVGYGPTEIYAYVKLSDGSVHISKNYVSSSYGAVN